jgi:alkyl hydroperoxide reductase subunit F
MYDLIIIGCGPAGMTAAVYAARKQLNILLVTEDFGGQPMWTLEIENYMGYQFVTGPELMDKFKEQVEKFPIQTQYEAVKKITVHDNSTFTVSTADHEYETKTVIVASGKHPKRLQVPGEMKLMGRGVSYCATCDGPLYSGNTVAVVGGGNSAVQAAIEMSTIANKVYLVIRDTYEADPILIDQIKNLANVVELFGYESKEILGDKFVEYYVITNIQTGLDTTLTVDGLFVEIGLLPNTEFIQGIVDLTEQGEIKVDCSTSTNVPGIFAAGDVNDGPDKQIVIAAGDGAKAVLSAYKYLLYQKK